MLLISYLMITMNQRKLLFRQICKEEKKEVVTNVTTFLLVFSVDNIHYCRILLLSIPAIGAQLLSRNSYRI